MNTQLKLGAIGAIALSMIVVSIAPSYAGRQGMWRQNHEQRFDNRHPRRSQVLDRSNNLNHRINANKGNLDGHYGQLKSQDNAIRKQEQRDARMNGGHITGAEQKQLNHEENRLNREIKNDK